MYTELYKVDVSPNSGPCLILLDRPAQGHPGNRCSAALHPLRVKSEQATYMGDVKQLARR